MINVNLNKWKPQPLPKISHQPPITQATPVKLKPIDNLEIFVLQTRDPSVPSYTDSQHAFSSKGMDSNVHIPIPFKRSGKKNYGYTLRRKGYLRH